MAKNLYGQLQSDMQAAPGTGRHEKHGDFLLLVDAEYSYEWFFKTAGDIEKARQRLLDGKKSPAPEQDNRLQSGTLLTVFNTISKGEVLWAGKVDLEHKRRFRPYPLNPKSGQQEVFGMWVHGFEQKLPPKDWASMFFSHLPAKLEKADGSTVYGALEPFAETETEGVIWSLTEYGKKGYDSLHTLDNGDNLTVYKTVTDGNVFWQGTVDFTDLQKPKPLRYLPHLETKRAFNGKAASKLEQACIGNFPARISVPAGPRR